MGAPTLLEHHLHHAASAWLGMENLKNNIAKNLHLQHLSGKKHGMLPHECPSVMQSERGSPSPDEFPADGLHLQGQLDNQLREGEVPCRPGSTTADSSKHGLLDIFSK